MEQRHTAPAIAITLDAGVAAVLRDRLGWDVMRDSALVLAGALDRSVGRASTVAAIPTVDVVTAAAELGLAAADKGADVERLLRRELSSLEDVRALGVVSQERLLELLEVLRRERDTLTGEKYKMIAQLKCGERERRALGASGREAAALKTHLEHAHGQLSAYQLLVGELKDQPAMMLEELKQHSAESIARVQALLPDPEDVPAIAELQLLLDEERAQCGETSRRLEAAKATADKWVNLAGEVREVAQRLRGACQALPACASSGTASAVIELCLGELVALESMDGVIPKDTVGLARYEEVEEAGTQVRAGGGDPTVATRTAELAEEERKEAEACEQWGDFPDASADLDSRVHGSMVGVLKAVHASLKRTKTPEGAKEARGKLRAHMISLEGIWRRCMHTRRALRRLIVTLSEETEGLQGCAQWHQASLRTWWRGWRAVVTNPNLGDAQARKTLLLLPKLAMHAPGRFAAAAVNPAAGINSAAVAADASAVRELRRQNKILRKEKKILLSQRQELLRLAKRDSRERKDDSTAKVTDKDKQGAILAEARATKADGAAYWQTMLAHEGRESELLGKIATLEEEALAHALECNRNKQEISRLQRYLDTPCEHRPDTTTTLCLYYTELFQHKKDATR
jgi:hypothetical protein